MQFAGRHLPGFLDTQFLPFQDGSPHLILCPRKSKLLAVLAVGYGPLGMFSLDHLKAILSRTATLAVGILWAGALHSPDYTMLGKEAIT